MRLIKPSAEILSITPNALKLIEAAGRTCYRSEDKITITSAGNFVAMILKRGHDSVLEHASATVRFICDRGVSHEIVRHRIASYSQESTRYCDYNGGHIEFIIPPWCDISTGIYDNDSIVRKDNFMWIHAMLTAEGCYKSLRADGWKPEQARSVLPNSLKTEIVMTANLREWRHFFKLRTAPAAHPQMVEITVPLLIEFQKQIPIIFDDILPNK
jgi:thymidylate synthase (FAD)